MINIKEIHEWIDHNFPNTRSIEQLLGIQEELGELSHHFLKRHQNIRMNEDHDDGIEDAVGDIFIYLVHFCYRENIDLEEAINKTWNHVKKRDWIKYPDTGVCSNDPHS
jgi:NTP pyrophosphatase (non-canonical NTP hydrolase)